jgi:hypothetical protein
MTLRERPGAPDEALTGNAGVPGEDRAGKGDDAEEEGHVGESAGRARCDVDTLGAGWRWKEMSGGAHGVLREVE